MKKIFIILGLAAVLSLVVFGCSSPTSTDGTGELALYLADKPVNNVQNVFVTLEEVQVKKEENDYWETITSFEDNGGEKQFDLLTLRFQEDLLGQQSLTTGHYTQFRLIVAADEQDQTGAGQYTGKSYIVYNDDTEQELFIPSGMQTGLKIPTDFYIEDGTITEITLDCNVAQVMHKAGNSGKIILNPSTAFDIIHNIVSGNIDGRVVADTDGDGSTEGITSQDVEVVALNDSDEVVASTVASSSETTVDGELKPIGYFYLRGIEEGTYDVKAYPVDENGDMDTSTYSEALVENVTVTAEQTTTIAEDIVLPPASTQ